MEPIKSDKKLLAHQALLIGVMLVWTGVRLLTGRWGLSLSIALWWLGGIIGFLFVFLDRLVYVFWQRPEETLSLKVRDLFAQKLFTKGLVTALQERSAQEHLIIRSALFLFVYLMMGFFAATSVGSMFGRGFMLGLGLHISFDLVSDYLGRGRDIRLWFWQIKRELSPTEITGVVWGFVILFALIALGL